LGFSIVVRFPREWYDEPVEAIKRAVSTEMAEKPVWEGMR
jgi:hypothetical protein